MPKKFWETTALTDMNKDEWESLCDGCGKCCMLKLQDEDTEEIVETRVHCKLFDPKTCQCSAYETRFNYVPDCVLLTPESVGEIPWLPETCAYRLVHEGQPLPRWHHLICGDRSRVITEGMSVQPPVINEDEIVEDNLEDYLIAFS